MSKTREIGKVKTSEQRRKNAICGLEIIGQIVDGKVVFYDCAALKNSDNHL